MITILTQAAPPGAYMFAAAIFAVLTLAYSCVGMYLASVEMIVLVILCARSFARASGLTYIDHVTGKEVM